MRFATILTTLLLATTPMTFARADAPRTSAPIVIELFTSEGCSSCPPADALLQRFAETQPDVIALGEHVDYWDRLGWKDRFSSAAFTARQEIYASRFNGEGAYTPQMVVDGREGFVGSDLRAAQTALDRARSTPHGTMRVEVTPSAGALAVTMTVSDLPKLSRGDRADVVVAVTEDRLRSDVKRGENRGRVLAHAAVVRHLATAGEAAADGPSTIRTEIPLGADWQRAALKVVAFAQERRGRAILASAAVPLALR